MTKVAQGLTIAALLGGAGRARAQAQPGYPPAPVQSGAPPAQPGSPAPVQPAYPPAPPAANADAPADYPPQYPPPPAPGYPPQPGAPPYPAPPGYPQQPYAPPPDYPQQPYPPATAYPQQPYGQPGYPPPGYPPPGYYPPGYYPPPPPPPPPPSSRPHGHGALLLLPYVGLNIHEGTTGQDEDPSFRFGSLIGYRVNGQLSLNVELTVDVLNLANQPAGTTTSGGEVDLSLSPLFHFDVGTLEMAVGPKLGFWGGVADTKDDSGTFETSASGVVVGGNLGAFFPLGNGASLGGLVSFVVRTVSNVCAKPDGGSKTCMDTPHADSEKVLGITAAALF